MATATGTILPGRNSAGDYTKCRSAGVNAATTRRAAAAALLQCVNRGAGSDKHKKPGTVSPGEDAADEFHAAPRARGRLPGADALYPADYRHPGAPARLRAPTGVTHLLRQSHHALP